MINFLPKRSDGCFQEQTTIASSADRTVSEFYLTDKQKDLINKVSTAFHSEHKKVVVVLNIAAPVNVIQWRDQVDAVLFAGEPGMVGGSAIAEILTGKVNPSGKLATTFPKEYADVPSAKNFPGKQFPEKAIVTPMGKSIPAEVTYEEGIYVGYRNYNTFSVKPAYEFGYGLSYTTFKYSPVKLSASTFNGKITASITITNSGAAPGKEVVELYLSAPANNFDTPVEELKAFAKTGLLQPGKSQTIPFTLTPKDLASYDTNNSDWIAEAGKYTMNIGASSLDIKQKISFSLLKEMVVERDNKSLTPELSISEIKPEKN